MIVISRFHAMQPGTALVFCRRALTPAAPASSSGVQRIAGWLEATSTRGTLLSGGGVSRSKWS